ncbi:hypothetical protein [Psychrobacter urativorans]|uniref:hypothetical protein n=1 Tax=Psychrobacter urativorans TaxID=45610 RepID=UPI00191A1446|nr:hypothetical protein [Psychrobacter urativorans]
MPSEVFDAKYLCIKLNTDNPALCDAWQQVQTGNFITPELAAQIIMFAFIINIVVYAFVAIRRVI